MNGKLDEKDIKGSLAQAEQALLLLPTKLI